MIKNIRLTSFVVLAIFFSGCAHLPDATIRYYLTKSKIKFNVTRTVTCDANNNVIVVNLVTPPSVEHLADLSALREIELADLKGPFSDTDVKFDFYKDGRLKAINSTITGQGKTIFEAAVNVVEPIILGSRGDSSSLNPCEFIKKYAGGKPLTLIYEGVMDLNTDSELTLKADPKSKFFHDELKAKIGEVKVSVREEVIPKKVAPLNYKAKAQKGDALLEVRQPILVLIEVKIDADPPVSLWKGRRMVALSGKKSYPIPIPAPTIFGKQIFAIRFHESGAIEHIQYANENSTGQALDVANSALTAFQGETTAEKLAKVRAEADLIVQQQRLARCIADPENCE